METLLATLIGRSVDVGCGSAAVFRGEIVEVRDGVLFLRDEEQRVTYLSVHKIASVCERIDSHSRPGFIG